MPSPTKTRWDLIVVAVIAGIIASGFIGKAPAALPTIRADLGLDLITGGWVVSIFNATAMSLGVAVGILTDRIGHGRLLLFGVAAMAAGAVIGAFAPDGDILLVARLIEGVGFVATVVAAPTLIVHNARDRDRTRALGVWTLYFPTGIALLVFLTPVFLNPFGWRGLWLASAAAMALCFVFLSVVLRGAGDTRPLPGERGSAWEDVRAVLTRPGPWLLAGCFASFSLQWSAVVMWLPSFVVEERGGSTEFAALFTGVMVAVLLVGNLAAITMLRRGVPFWAIVAGVSVAVSLTCVGIFNESLPDWMRIGFCLLFSVLGGIIPVATMINVPVFAPSPRQLGATNGLVLQGANFGLLFGPPAVATLVAASGGWQAALWFPFAAAAAGVGLAFLVRPIERRQAAQRAAAARG